MDGDLEGRWRDLDTLLLRPGNVVGPGFEPCPEVREFLRDDARILCIGAGGLGCELLKDLALSGFGHIDVIDMDTIDVSNLNRQFLFRMKDVGKPKAVVAAEMVNKRVAGVEVTPHFCRIEDKPAEFYKDFHIIVLGLDSVEARSWINQMACSFLEWDEDGELDQSTLKPMVDGGTEGFKGHARVILPGVTPCFQCTLWLFPPQVTFPLCTLAETPRSAPHCIEYVKLIQWGQDRAGEEFDADNPENMEWVYHQALARAQHYNIPGVTLSLTQGVTKNIIPAIASTNAIVAAACTLEALKIATMCSTGMNNYMMYVGSEGVYTHTVAYERDDECVVCGAGMPLKVAVDVTLQGLIDVLLADGRIGGRITAPSLSCAGKQLYVRGAMEELTRDNLPRRVAELIGDKGGVININDKKLDSTLRVLLSFEIPGPATMDTAA